MFSVRTTPEKFEYGGFTLKTRQMFSVHTEPGGGGKGCKNAIITGHFGFCVSGNLGQGNHVIIVTSSFLKKRRFSMKNKMSLLPFFDARNRAAPTPFPTKGSASRMLFSVSCEHENTKRKF